MTSARGLLVDLSAALAFYVLTTLLIVAFGHVKLDALLLLKQWVQLWKSPPAYLLGATGAGAIAAAGLMLWNPFRVSTEYGDARYATLADMKKMGLASPKGLILGLAFGMYVRTSQPLSTLVLAPPGAGKTSAIVIPTLLSCGNSMLICDIKGELYETTSKRRAQFSTVLKFQPASSDTCRWNPFDPAELPEEWTDIVIHVERVASILFKKGKHGGDEYWVEEGRSVFIFYALYLIHKMRTLPEGGERPYVSIPEIRAKALAEADVQAWMARALDEETDLPRRVKEEGNSLVGKADKEFSGVFSTFKSKLNVFADDRVRNAMSGADFCANDFRRKQLSVYVLVKLVDMMRLQVLLNLLFEMTAATLMSQEANAVEQHVTFMLDEFVRMGKMDIIKDMPALSRSYKLNAVFVAQDYGQISELYGSEAISIFETTTAYKVVFAQNDFTTMEKISKLIGPRTRARMSHTTGAGKSLLEAGTSSQSESLEGVPLVLPQQIGSIPTGRCLILAKGYYNRPIRARAASYYNDRRMRALIGSI